MQNWLQKCKRKLIPSAIFHCALTFGQKNAIGFLGKNLNFLNDEKMDSMLLALKQVDFPHTSQVVLSETNDALKCWKIQELDDPRITYILTDNGSNMVKAYAELNGLLSDSSQSGNDNIDSDPFDFVEDIEVDSNDERDDDDDYL